MAIVSMLVGVLALTLTGSWAQARWPNAAGEYITVIPQSGGDAVGVLSRLRRVDGVRDAVAVLRGPLALDETVNTGWSSAWLQANYTDRVELAFLPPDPTLELWQGCLPEPDSADEAVLAYELAQTLRLSVGDSLRVQNRSLAVAGIWGPSSRVPGNWAQVSAAAAETLLPTQPAHFVVIPVDRREVTQVARRIWQAMPDMTVLSPGWEVARAQRERAALGSVLGVAICFLLLLAAPAWASAAEAHWSSTMLAALLSGAGGLSVGWAATALANLYATNTLGLTPFRMTPRLALAVLGLTGLVWLLGVLSPFRRSWRLRCVATVLVLALCSAAVVTVGALSESLHASLGEARLAAADWVTLVGVEVNQRLLQAVYNVPGIRGYMIEARGGLANEDEERWLGPSPPSGVFYGVRVVGGEGTLSVPYRLGYWRGGPLDPDKSGQTVVGYELAQARRLEVGDSVEIRGVPFAVVGIRERLSVDPSSEANYRLDISWADLARVLHRPVVSGEMTLLIPPAESQEEKTIFLQELAARLNVERVQTIEDRLAQIARSYPAAWTLTQASALEAVRHAQVSYTNAVLLCAVFCLVASGLSVAATMKDRLARDEERIALLKALGSAEGVLLGEYLQMAALLGIVAGLLGVLSGWVVVSYVNTWGPSGSPQLMFTPRLGAAVFFALATTAVGAAVAPTMDAVRQDATWPLYSSSPAKAVQGGSVS